MDSNTTACVVTGRKAWIRNNIAVSLAKSICELMESLEWWRMNEGGITSHDKVLEGIRTGGCRTGEYLTDNCLLVQLASQKPGARSRFNLRVEIAEKALLSRQPIGVIVDRGHPGLLSRGIALPDSENFALLGTFLLSDVWVAWDDSKQVLMCRLDKTSQDGVWWSDHGGPETTRTSRVPNADTFEDHTPCQVCGRPLVKRYNQLDAFCGHPRCPSTQPNGPHEEIKASTVYHQAYIEKHPTLNNVPAFPFSWLPPPPTQLTKQELFKVFHAKKQKDPRPLWNGWYCRDCHRFNSRVFWDKLVCRVCGQVIAIKLPDLHFEDLVGPTWLDLQDSDTIGGITVGCGVKHTILKSTAEYITHAFDLFEGNAVYVIYPKRKAIYQQGGFKDLFDRLWKAAQDGEIPLSRCNMESKKIPGQLTRWFGKNYGKEYKTRMVTETSTLDEAPAVITDITTHLSAIVEEVLGTPLEFNEVLTIGNYPKMAMSWHQDGEDKVGPVVASLSLGGPATMRFALANEFFTGKGRRYSYEILPGCLGEGKKRELLAQKESGLITPDEFLRQYRAVVDGLKPPCHPQKLLEFPLPGSGAVMIQKGATLNKYYLHMVENKGIARIVNTVRHLKDDV